MVVFVPFERARVRAVRVCTLRLSAPADRLATAKHPGAAHELVACCKALAAIDAATREAVVYLPGPRWKPPGTGRRSRSRCRA